MKKDSTQTANVLKQSENQLQAIIDAARDAIIMMDPDGFICYWNRAAEKLFGYSDEEVTGKNLHQLIAPRRYHEAHKSAFAGFRLTGQGVSIDTTQETTACNVPRELDTEFKN